MSDFDREPTFAPPCSAHLPDAPGFDDPRLVVALEEYLERGRAGRWPGRAEFLGRHHEIAGVLVECIDGLEFIQGSGSEEDSPGGGVGPATFLGDFRVVREIGRGGMGVVYEAEQISLGRRVALKILPSAAALDPRHRQRFRIESQAAALLHHEHIVPVFCIGSDDGTHFLAMQLIVGGSLADLIARRLPSLAEDLPSEDAEDDGRAPGDGLGTGRQYARIVARLGVQAAGALDHAHAVGVLHRDIKPSNLLVDDGLHLWVTDFGLARIQDDPGPTQSGDVLGTLRYASPEQLRGDHGFVDQRTDIYSLGVTLYELLTLRPAFEGRSRQDLLHRILNGDAVAPRKIDASIPRDLETIVLKAMAGEPSKRYASAAELGADLRRFLEDRPIRARRPTPFERAAMWSRRHRPLVVSTATVLALALVVGSSLVWQAKRHADTALASMRESSRQAEMALFSLRESRVRERIGFEATFAAMDQITLPRMLAERGSGRPLTGPEKDGYRVLVAFYDRIAEMFADSPSQGELVAKSSRRAGLCRMVLRDPRADPAYHRAIRVYERLAREHPERIWLRTELIDTLRDYARELEGLGRSAESDGVFRRALSVAEGLLDVKDASLPCFRAALVGQFNDLAWSSANLPPGRRPDPDLAVRLARWCATWEPNCGPYWGTLALAHYRAGDWAAAMQAAEASRKLGSVEPEDWLVLAMIHHRRNQPELARQRYDQARDLFERSENRPPASPQVDRLRAEAEALLSIAPARSSATTPVVPAS